MTIDAPAPLRRGGVAFAPCAIHAPVGVAVSMQAPYDRPDRRRR